MNAERLNPMLAEFWPVTQAEHARGWKEVRVEFTDGRSRMVRLNAPPVQFVAELALFLAQPNGLDVFLETCSEPGKGQTLLPIMPHEIARLTPESDALLGAVCVALTVGAEYTPRYGQVMELILKAKRLREGRNPRTSKTP
jgi:hypothetical protein